MPNDNIVLLLSSPSTSGVGAPSKIIKNGISVIINIFAEMVVGILLSVTDQIELILIISFMLDILLVYFTKFITTRMLLDGKLEELESVIIRFFKRVDQFFIFVIMNILATIIKISFSNSILQWYEVLTLAIIILALAFTIIQKYI